MASGLACGVAVRKPARHSPRRLHSARYRNPTSELYHRCHCGRRRWAESDLGAQPRSRHRRGTARTPPRTTVPVVGSSFALSRPAARAVSASRRGSQGSPCRPRRGSSTTIPLPARANGSTDEAASRACRDACRFGELSQQPTSRTRGRSADGARGRRSSGTPRNRRPTRASSVTSIWSRWCNWRSILLCFFERPCARVAALRRVFESCQYRFTRLNLPGPSVSLTTAERSSHWPMIRPSAPGNGGLRGWR